jgi:membrane protease YdiL (CAAX protease family)
VVGLFLVSIPFLEISLTVIDFFLDLLKIPPITSSPYDEYFADPIITSFFALLVILIGPIFEEIIFRKQIFGILEHSSSSKLNIIITSSIIFTLTHLPADLVNGSLRYTFEHLFVIFFLGIVLGTIFNLYGLKYAILFHSLWNSMELVFQLDIISENFPDLFYILLILGFLIIGFVIILTLFSYDIVNFLTKNAKKSKNSVINTKIPFFTNLLVLLVYEVVIAVLIYNGQNYISQGLLLVLHVLGIILGFLIFEYESRKYQSLKFTTEK